MNASPRRDLNLLKLAAFLRALGTGLVGVVLGIYLSRAGFPSLAIGLVIALGLAGSALATAILSCFADRAGRKVSLLILALLSALGGLALALSPILPVLAALAFLGMLNGTGTDRSALYALEQAVIPGLAPAAKRTWNLAFYNLLIDGGSALGALGAGLPVLFHQRSALSLLGSYRVVFAGYAALCLTTAALYLFLSPAVELAEPPATTLGGRISTHSRGILARITALFSLDAFGGGFLTDALVAYWFFRRFGITEANLGFVFFAVHLLNAGSHLGAAGLARRIGLVNTMVFTHLPSSLFLMAVPFAPSPAWAIALFLCREALVEMDVPTRQSYVAALVKPGERTFASGITNLARNVFWGIGSATAGVLMQGVAFSAPLLVGGSAKITYDLLLYRSFRKVRPPEEQ